MDIEWVGVYNQKEDKEMAKEVNEEVMEEEVENQTQIPTESKKAKVWKVIKAVAYGAAFVAGAGVVLVLSHLGDKDNEKEEEKKVDDLDDLDKIKEDNSITTTVF